MTKHEVIEILRDIKNLKENKDIPFGLIEKYIMMIDEKATVSATTSNNEDWGGIAREQSGHLRNPDVDELSITRKIANSRASEGDPYPF